MFCFVSAHSQLPFAPQPVYIHYNSYNSELPTDLVYKVIADQYGYTWLATDKGLVKYDGKHFEVINIGRLEDIISIYRTSDNILWLFTYSGKTRGINLNNHHIINTDSLYGISKLKLPAKPFPMAVQCGSKLFLKRQATNEGVAVDLIAKRSTPISRLSDQILNFYKFSGNEKEGRLRSEMDSFLIQHNSGMYLKDTNLIIGNKIYVVKENMPPVFLFDGNDYNLTDFIESAVRRENDLYIGGLKNTGFLKISGFFNRPRTAQTIEKILPDEQVTDIRKDYLGNIWVSTYTNGLFFFPAAESRTLYYNKTTSKLSSDEITFIRRFQDGTLVLGYNNSTTDFIRNNISRRYTLPVQNSFPQILFAEKTRHRWLLFTRSEAFGSGISATDPWPSYFKPLRLKNKGISQGYKHGKLLDDVFYYASGNGVLTIDSSGLIAYHNLYRTGSKKTCVLPLSNTNIYVGTVRGGFKNTSPLPYLSDDQFNSIQYFDGSIAFCTNTGAYIISEAAALDKAQLKRLTQYAAYDIKQDEQYFYIRNGRNELEIIDKKSLHCRQVFQATSYIIPFKLNDFSVDTQYISLAGNKGLFQIPKATVLNTSEINPQAHIISSIYGFSPLDSIFECKYNSNFSASFELQIPDYSNSRKMITYRLFKDGREMFKRTDLSENTQVNFQPGSPGNYIIQYQVHFGDEVPDKIISFSLHILPLWYQQLWFLSLAIILSFILLVYIVYRIISYRSSINQRKLNQKLYIRELEAKSLFGQLKPHFIFNLLTPLQGYFLKGQKMEGLDYLSNFSSLMRGILTGIREKYAGLDKEIEFAKQYLEVQQTRFNNSFTYKIAIPPGITPSEYQVPTLLIQPLLENAIEHGLSSLPGKGEINVTISKTVHELNITITDNGKGLPVSFELKHNHALEIISERMELLRRTEGTGSFSIRNRTSEQGVEAILILPLNINP